MSIKNKHTVGLKFNRRTKSLISTTHSSFLVFENNTSIPLQVGQSTPNTQRIPANWTTGWPQYWVSCIEHGPSPSSLLMGFVWNQCHKLCFLCTYLPSLTTNAFHIYPPTNPPNSSTTRYVCIHRWPLRPSLFGNWDTNGCSTRWRNFFVFLVFCCCLLISLSLSLSLSTRPVLCWVGRSWSLKVQQRVFYSTRTNCGPSSSSVHFSSFVLLLLLLLLLLSEKLLDCRKKFIKGHNIQWPWRDDVPWMCPTRASRGLIR